nr:SDR family oxidoreductase [Actinomycetota bacterium]
MNGELAGRVAVVTGAAGGLGSAVCRVFAREGASVLPVDIRGDSCFLADVGTAEGNRAMVTEAISRHGRLDALVLNAGAQFIAPIADFPETEWDRLFDLMVKGPWLATKAAWTHLVESGDGRIIVTASSLSLTGEEYKAAYVAAKHAVTGLVKVAALEGGPHGIRANAVAPGLMWTGLMENQLDDQMRLRNLSREALLERIELSQPIRAVETEEVAEVIAFLASPRASGVSGTCIPVDLGLVAT